MAEEAPEDLTAAEAEVLPQTAEEKVQPQGFMPMLDCLDAAHIGGVADKTT